MVYYFVFYTYYVILDVVGDVMSIYIHIPFCNYICSYCDFCKIIYDKKYVKKYLDSLRCEVISRYKGEEVKTIYIGGGTPSSLDIDELIMLLDIISLFNLSSDYEFTIEGNIESINEDKLIVMKEYGVNRISVEYSLLIVILLNYLVEGILKKRYLIVLI